MKIQGKSLEKPKKIEWEEGTLTPTYGKCSVEPFERGYGNTIGNALRRILISSLPGAAITSVKIEGVLHEFSSISGVMEDVPQILFNLKQVYIILSSDSPKWIKLSVAGERDVRARDIEADNDVQILNPDFHIATLNNRDAKLVIEMLVEVGHGYVPAEKLKKDEPAIGEIPLDAIFSPVKRVRFDVQNTRVGQIIDYEKLTLEIWTDGRIKPQEALSHAVGIFKQHLVIFGHEDENNGSSLAKDGVDEEREKLREMFTKSVEELEFSVRAANCLKNANIKTIGELVGKNESEMLKYRNFGRKSLTEIKEVLTEMNLFLGMDVTGISENK